VVQAAGLRAWDEGQDFKALVKADERVRALLSEQEIDDLFDPTWHTRNIDTTYQRLQIGEEKLTERLKLAALNPPLMDAALPGLTLFSRGKVRDTFDLGDHLLMVATDRVSAFDVLLPNGIPDKGAILTQMSRWWFERTAPDLPQPHRAGRVAIGAGAL